MGVNIFEVQNLDPKKIDQVTVSLSRVFTFSGRDPLLASSR